MLLIFCFKGMPCTVREREREWGVNQIEREAVRNGEAERENESERERAICFERSFSSGHFICAN